MMPARHQGLLRLFIACALPLLALQSAAAADWQLEKVVELSRHGIRPPTAGNREAIEAATGRPWTEWTTHDGELTGHGYAAVVNKGRAEGQHYRQLGLLQAGCPTAESIYVRASPLQRTRATAQALVDGAFPAAASLSIMSAGMPIPVSDRQVRRHANRPRPPAGGGEREGRGSGAASAGAGADHPAIETGGLSGR